MGSELENGLIILGEGRTQMRKTTRYTSSRVARDRYNAVKAIAGGIVYLRCLVKLVSALYESSGFDWDLHECILETHCAMANATEKSTGYDKGIQAISTELETLLKIFARNPEEACATSDLVIQCPLGALVRNCLKFLL